MPGQYDLVAFGNPLLDMSIRDGEEVLKKYNLKSNDAILVEPQHESIYEYIVQNYKVQYVAGGAAQNTARAAQYILPEKSTAYLGAVGNDDLAQQLRAANDREGLRSAYQVTPDHPTGSCAVVITGHDRSLVTRLGAAEKFDKAHLETPEVKQLTDNAKFFYMGGFFVTHGAEVGLIVAKKAKEIGVPFSLNLSAPFIPQFFTQQLDSIIPYASLVIGNESEAVAYAEAHKLGTTDLSAIAEAIANSPSEISKPRTVVITHGSEPTILVEGGNKPRTIPTKQIPASEIVDTNGAGDAFAGGVVGALILGKSIDEAVQIGQKLGGMCIGQDGPRLKFPKEQVV
ncbi:Ribokinase-like protein [Ceraceosorus guamensis]|uniref:Adenosine kinase n=1 Tax=Ceraceosorus guamensis TaxID=1522189 RepID=A0A316W754_9BASI|nr:Ribokinase-like protein [Ceraceosorus guamensis]PWN45679.1 Ribokinase-like protein [Ceraceosorus guamensis]